MAKYQEMWEIRAPARPLNRIVEYHPEANDEAEATRWVEKGLDHNTPVNYENPAAKALLEKVKARREAKPK